MHVAVTGASSGIGEALARELAAAGHDITLVARRYGMLKAIADTLPGRTHIEECDLAKLDEATTWIPRAEAALGPIDVLVNNAGVQVVGPFDEIPVAEGDRILDVDLRAPMRITLAVLPGMRARGRGVIVDVASLAAIAPTPGMSWYNAAKGGFAAFSEGLRGEVRRSGIHIVTVYPGPVKTPMADAALHSYEKLPGPVPTGNVAELARRVRRAIERKSPRVIYPRLYWLAWWFPTLTSFIVDRIAPTPRLGGQTAPRMDGAPDAAAGPAAPKP